MVDEPQGVADERWQQLLTLVEELIDQPSAAAQQKRIATVASRLLDGQARVWLSEAAYQFPGATVSGQFSVRPPAGVMRQSFETLQTIQSVLPLKKTGSTTGYCAVAPIVANKMVFGVVQVTRSAGPDFTGEDIDALSHLTRLAALAFQVTRQVAIKNWRYEQLALVRDVSAQIANMLDLDDLASTVTRLIRDTFQYYYVVIFTCDPGEELLRYRACAHLARAGSEDGNLPIPSIRSGEGMIGYVAQNGVELLASDVKHEPRYRHFDSLPETQSEVAFPLKINNRVLGVLDVQSNQTDAFHEMDILVLRSLADSIALAVEGARLYNDVHRRAEQLAIIGEVSRRLASILELDPLLEQIVDLIHKRLGFPFVHLFTVHPGRRKVFYRAGRGRVHEPSNGDDLSYDLDDPQGIIPWVARNGKTMIANDVDAQPLYRPSPLPPNNTRAEMAVPLIYGGEISGVLDIQSDRTGAFTEEDRFVFEALADAISIAIRNAMLYRSERWRRQAAESLHDVAGLLSSEAALDRVLDVILTELERNLPCDIVAIWLLDENSPADSDVAERPLLLAAVHGGDKRRMHDTLALIPESKDLLARALAENRPLIRTGRDSTGPIGEAFGYPVDYSSIVAPLRAGDHPLGVLALAHPTTGRYGSEALSMTAAFASYAAVAIQNNRLYSTAQEQAWVSTVMLQVADAAQTATTVDELFDIVVRLTPMLVGVQSCAFFTWNPIAESLTLAAEHNLDPLLHQKLRGCCIDLNQAAALRRLRETAAPVTIADLSIDFGLCAEIAMTIRHAPMLLLPLVARGEFLGAFLIEQQTPGANGRVEAFNDQRSAILQGIVQQTAIAVENIGLLEAKQEEAYVTAVLLQVAQAVVSLNDLNDILDAIAHIMPILVGIDACIIYLWDPQYRMFRPSKAFTGNTAVETQLLEHPFQPEEYPLLNEVFRRDSLVVCALMDPPQLPQDWNRVIPAAIDGADAALEDARNLLMGFPLSVKGDVYGVLVAQETSSTLALRERRQEIITGIAQQAALAIQNDHLNREMVGRERLEREFQLAREIQQTFLPSEMPSLPGWELDVRWRPARRVGGDFYDCFELPGNRLGLVIADVSDKGMPAALYMTVARTLIRATAQDGSPPAQVLMRVNDLLLMDSQSGMFVTGIYAILALDSGEMVYTNAGHNLPLWMHGGDKTLEQLAKGGIALGAWDKIHLTDHHIQLAPGDTLLFYTDGVTEAFSQSNDVYGENRLDAVMLNDHGGSARKLLDAIDSSLVEFLGDAPPSDDITLLAMRRTPNQPH